MGVDPGMRDFYVAAKDGDNRDQHMLHRCSYRMYSRARGFPGGNLERAKELRANPDIQRGWSRTPTSKTTDFGVLEQYVRHRTRTLKSEVEFSCTKSRGRFRRWQGKVQKDRAMAAMAHAIVRGHQGNVVVGVGNANAGHMSTVSRAGIGSHKGLRWALANIPHVEVRGIDEYNTSKYCSHCVQSGTTELQELESVRGLSNRYTVKRCPGCKRVR